MQQNPSFSRVILPALTVELRWKSKAGMRYQIEESTDLMRWEPALPAALTGTGNDMTWITPLASMKKSYRVRESCAGEG